MSETVPLFIGETPIKQYATDINNVVIHYIAHLLIYYEVIVRYVYSMIRFILSQLHMIDMIGSILCFYWCNHVLL